MSAPALPELPESEARGRTLEIYTEIRALCAVPYVSSLQRHLATRDGWLEWCWAAVRPAFACGAAQTAAWRAAGTVAAPQLEAIPRAALRVLGVDATAETAIRNVCESFVRVSPTNLAFSGLVRRLLAGETPADAGLPGAPWTPPAPLATLPPLVDGEAISADQRAVLECFATEIDGHPFVPGLYRMLAHWPGLLAHLAVVLAPHLGNVSTQARCRTLAEAVDATMAPVLAALPAHADGPPRPPTGEHAAVLAAIDRYRITSPEMVLFGAMIRDALPGDR